MTGIDRFADKERRKQRRRLQKTRDKKKITTPGTRHWYDEMQTWNSYTVDDMQDV